MTLAYYFKGLFEVKLDIFKDNLQNEDTVI